MPQPARATQAPTDLGEVRLRLDKLTRMEQLLALQLQDVIKDQQARPWGTTIDKILNLLEGASNAKD